VTFVIGVDGGGTHARALILDEGGRELGRGEARGAVVSAAAPMVAARAVVEAVRAAAANAQVELPGAALWAGLAGAGLEDPRRAVAEPLEDASLAEHVVVGTDVEAAFQDAFGAGPGVLLIAGTGSIAWARSPSGAVVRVGGWGERLGDEGSGFAIGMAALRAVVRAEDGRGPGTVLRELLLSALSLGSVDGLVPWAAVATKADVAALVPLVSRAASAGDAVASDILTQAVGELSAHVAAAVERGGPWPQPPELVLWGGLLGKDGALHDRIARAVGAHRVRLSTRDVDPARGAARLARAALVEGPPQG
jgi:glucosamine kinase